MPPDFQVTEMASDPSGNMNWMHTNVWAGGNLIGTYSGTVGAPCQQDGTNCQPECSQVGQTCQTGTLSFYLTDWLETRRAQTDYAGIWQQDCASLPFGDQLACTGSTTSPTEHHFTGKERDAESGNDYFEARYYSSPIGRFSRPDWSATITPVPYAKINDPQSLNLYAYMRNNPLGGSDADGHDFDLATATYNFSEGNGFTDEPDIISGGPPEWAQGHTAAPTAPLSMALALFQESIPDWVEEEVPTESENELEPITIGGPIEYGPDNPGPLPQQVADSFMGGRYAEVTVGSEGWGADEVFYRNWGGSAGETGSRGTYYSLQPLSPLQNIMDNAVAPEFGNTSENTACVFLKPGTRIYVGLSAPQTINPETREPYRGWAFGGTLQVYVPK